MTLSMDRNGKATIPLGSCVDHLDWKGHLAVELGAILTGGVAKIGIDAVRHGQSTVMAGAKTCDMTLRGEREQDPSQARADVIAPPVLDQEAGAEAPVASG